MKIIAAIFGLALLQLFTVSVDGNPQNTDCGGAKVVPITTFPYVDVVNFTEYPPIPSIGTSPSCVADLEATVKKELWYEFTPTADGVLTVFSIDFIQSFASSTGVDISLAASIGSCNNLTELKYENLSFNGQDGFEVLHTIVEAGLTYFVQVADISEIGVGLVNVTFSFDPYDIEVTGDECTDARMISHASLPYNEVIDTRLYTFNPDDVFHTCEFAPGFSIWYKYQAPMDGLLTFDTRDSFIDFPLSTVFTYFRNLELEISLGAFTGGCNNLTQVFCANEANFEAMFVPVKAGETYIIKISPTFFSLFAVGLVNVRVSFQRNYFHLLAEGNRVAVLNDILTGEFANDATDSVRLQLDGQRKSICENIKPYEMIGTNGQTNVPFPLGKQVITATGYSRPNCIGTILDTASQDFLVKGCAFLYYELYDASRDVYVTTVNNASIVANPPCQVNLGVSFSCGFQPDKVRLELRSASNNTLVASRDEFASPYFLFGDSGRGNIYSGRIPAGEYVLIAIINNIVHPSVRFTMGACKASNVMDKSFNIDLRFGSELTSSTLFSEYETAKLFQTIVNRVSSLILEDKPDLLNTSDVSNNFYRGAIPARVDDLFICAVMLDYWEGEAGLLGYVREVYTNPNNNLPVAANVFFDETAFIRLLKNGNAESFILLQLIRALGLGGSWSTFELAEQSSPCSYSGAKAKAEFAAITGCSSDIPLEQNAIPLIDQDGGVDCRFWDSNCLKNEVLTYTLGEKKISRITLGALEDLGYVVNYTAADPYGLDDIGTCSGCRRRNLKNGGVSNNDDKKPKKSCGSGIVHQRAVHQGRKMLRDAHERYMMAKSKDKLEELAYVGNQRITLMYEHEDGTLCAVDVVRGDDLF